MDFCCFKVMTNAPVLLIFDIDKTLLEPQACTTPDQVRQSLYDSKLLTSFFNPKYQIAIASYNHDISTREASPRSVVRFADAAPQLAPFVGGGGHGVYGGRRLGRIILDLQHPSGSSKQAVEDGFIQAWVYPTMELMDRYGKNEHIRRILTIYRKKYGRDPAEIFFYDDLIHNVYLASTSGIRAYWVTAGLTRNNIHRCMPIGNRVKFSIASICNQLKDFIPYIHQHPRKLGDQNPIYSLYLPSDHNTAMKYYIEFLKKVHACGDVLLLTKVPKK